MARLGIRLMAEPVRTEAFGDIGAAYSAIGTPLDHEARIVLIQNLTDESVMISMDGVNDHFPLPENGYIILDVCTNRSTTSEFYIAKETQFYVKELSGSPTLGAVYLSVFYAYN